MSRSDDGTRYGAGLISESDPEGLGFFNKYYENEWHHTVITYDGTEFKFYQDGVLQNTSYEDSSLLTKKYAINDWSSRVWETK